MFHHTYRRNSRQNRKGGALVYVVITMTIMMGLTSLVVDLGRAEVATIQLQAVADAAAGAAAQDLCDAQSTATATADAIAVASQNTVDGQTVTITSSNIVYGNWSGTAFTANGSPTNAVQVTIARSAANGNAIPTVFAQALGRSSVDTHAVSTAYVNTALASFNLNGNASFNLTSSSSGAGTSGTDSFISKNGSYSSSSARLNGNMMTDGNVAYQFTWPSGVTTGNMWSTVGGTIYSTNGANCTCNLTVSGGSYSVGATYGGWVNPGATTQQEPSSAGVFTTPTMPTGNTNPTIPTTYLSGSHANGLQDLTVSDGSTLTLPGGVYTLNSITVSAGSTVKFSGPVTLNVATNLSVDAAALSAQNNNAINMKINMCNTGSAGANSVTITNPTAAMYADVNGPLANFTWTDTGNSGHDFYGRIFANNFTQATTAGGSQLLHADESLSTYYSFVQ